MGTPGSTDFPLSRRTVAKGAAWTLPVVALASAAPGASASSVPVCTDCISASGIGKVEQSTDQGTYNSSFGANLTKVGNSCTTGFDSLGITGAISATGTLPDGSPVTADNAVFGPTELTGTADSNVLLTAVFPSGYDKMTKVCFEVSVHYVTSGAASTGDCQTSICWGVL